MLHDSNHARRQRVRASMVASVALGVMTLILVICIEGCGSDEATGEKKSAATRWMADAGFDGGARLPTVNNEACADTDDGTLCGRPGYHCVDTRCVVIRCGDGVLDALEECDDGNAVYDDGCSPDCMIQLSACGDGRLHMGEECDDGNKLDDDECSNRCTSNICGNGRRDGAEECDDGNLDNEDACSNECTRNRCRNGRLDPGEECDDGNLANADGCSNDCRRVACGDGQIQSGEECDDGNQNDVDDCSAVCTLNVCGNQRVDPGEACDGDRDVAGDLCNAACSGYETDTCAPCMKAQCTDYQGFDMYTPCYEDVSTVTQITDPLVGFVQKCTAASECYRRTRCAKHLQDGSAPCFCDGGVANCQETNTLSGPCAAETAAAVAEPACPVEGDALCTLGGAVDLTLPAGYAYFMDLCRFEKCASECGWQ